MGPKISSSSSSSSNGRIPIGSLRSTTTSEAIDNPRQHKECAAIQPTNKSIIVIKHTMNQRSCRPRKRYLSWLVPALLGLIQHNHHGVGQAEAYSMTAPLNSPSSPLLQQKSSSRFDTRQFAKRTSQGTGNSGDHHTAKTSSATGKPGWRRRVLSRLRRNKRVGSLEARSALQEEVATTPPPFLSPSVDQFILDNFERLSPEQLFSALEKRDFVLDGSSRRGDDLATTASIFFETPLELPLLDGSTLLDDTPVDDEENEEVDVLECVVAASQIGATSSFEGGPPIRKMARNWFQNLLTKSFEKWAAETPENLQVRCSPTGAVLPQLLRGQFQCNARVDFDRIVFPFLQCSGGSVEGSSLSLNLLAFTVDRSAQAAAKNNQTNTNGGTMQKQAVTPSTKRKASTKAQSRSESKVAGLLEAKKASPRYQTQFELHANDCVFSQEDLFASNCVRNGLQDLVKRIIKRRGLGFNSKSVVVTDISVLSNGQISCRGEATAVGMSMMLPKVTFEVRTGIDFKNRGHVLTFPNLEVSGLMGPDMGLFVPIPNVELDIGHNARVRELVIDGAQKHIKIGFSTTITPEHTRKLSNEYTQCSDAYSAKFSYDVGRWLTRIGKFSL